jgi:hypothetical protein
MANTDPSDDKAAIIIQENPGKMVYGVMVVGVNPAETPGIVFSSFFGNEFVQYIYSSSL